MRTHDVLERMCALAASGQLDPDESMDFEIHLMTCDNCRADLEAYRAIVKEMTALPPVERGLEPSTQRQNTVSFLSRLGSEKIETSSKARDFLLSPKTSAVLISRLVFVSIATAALLVAVLLPRLLVRRNSASPLLANSGIAHLQQRLESDRQIIAALQRERDEARSKLQTKDGQAPALSELERKLADAQRDAEKLRADLRDHENRVALSAAQAQDKDHQIASLESKISALEDSVQLAEADMVSSRAEVARLQDQLQGEKLSVEQEKQLNTAAKDVRELMGARRLFMIDVYDGENLATANRSFGRVFYTQGRSLIFYAFDLDQHRNFHKVTFQAWGEKGKNPASVKPLGIFQVDDVAQRRWVMKVDDPEKLKTIDAVFVTVEPSHNPARPTGQKLLYAFLGGQPNHP